MAAGPALESVRSVHLIGAGGAGMSGLARLLVARGVAVSGSDRAESGALLDLRALGAEVWVGHDAGRLGSPELVAVSSAIRDDNPELVEARRRDLPVVGRARLLGRLMDGKVGVAVAGTHGKTTTTAMLAAVLEAAGSDPSYAVGGDLLASGDNARAGGGPHFIAEADESDGSFLELPATVAVVTSVGPDHLDHYGDLDAVRAAFGDFVARLPADGTAVLCADDPDAAALAERAGCPVLTYGLDEGADVSARQVELDARGSSATCLIGGEPAGDLRVAVPGRHNLANALAAVAASGALGTPFEAARTALAGFAGTARRFHHRGEAGGVTVVDDYAHNPAKVAACLATARLQGAKRVLAVFQPHLYSRTRLFAAELGAALAGGADLVVVTDVYAAREEPELGVDGHLVAEAVTAAGTEAHYVPERSQLAARVAALAQPGDLVVTIGAGDVTTVPAELLALLEASG